MISATVVLQVAVATTKTGKEGAGEILPLFRAILDNPQGVTFDVIDHEDGERHTFSISQDPEWIQSGPFYPHRDLIRPEPPITGQGNLWLASWVWPAYGPTIESIAHSAWRAITRDWAKSSPYALWLRAQPYDHSQSYNIYLTTGQVSEL